MSDGELLCPRGLFGLCRHDAKRGANFRLEEKQNKTELQLDSLHSYIKLSCACYVDM